MQGSGDLAKPSNIGDEDMIKVTCYGKTDTFKSKKQAIAYFMEGVYSCDPNSSECGRYMYIISELMAGAKEVSDVNY